MSGSKSIKQNFRDCTPDFPTPPGPPSHFPRENPKLPDKVQSFRNQHPVPVFMLTGPFELKSSPRSPAYANAHRATLQQLGENSKSSHLDGTPVGDPSNKAGPFRFYQANASDTFYSPS